MNIIVEDNPYRIIAIRKMIRGTTLCFDDAGDVIAFLSNPEIVVGIMFLDHDLGGEKIVSDDPEQNGMRVAKWLAENHRSIGRIIVHSLNVPAASEMTKTLSDAGYSVEKIPFLELAKIAKEIGGELNEQTKAGV